MPKETISVCIERDEKAASDAIAAQSDRDLSQVVEEALSAYGGADHQVDQAGHRR